MKRIIVLSFQDVDVSEGLDMLLRENPDATIFLPMTDTSDFVQSVITTAKKHNIPYHLFVEDGEDDIDEFSEDAKEIVESNNPLKAALAEVTPDDILAIVWDESTEARIVINALDDYGVETWDITDGLVPLTVTDSEDVESDLLFEEMHDRLSDFIEAFSIYIIAGITQTMTNAFKERLAEEEGKRDISPFKDKD